MFSQYLVDAVIVRFTVVCFLEQITSSSAAKLSRRAGRYLLEKTNKSHISSTSMAEKPSPEIRYRRLETEMAPSVTERQLTVRSVPSQGRCS